jgi:F0F1-type ATP synthase membrane subunit b/b'
MQFSSAVSVDPLILAEANRIVDTTRQEALQFAGNVVGQVRGEAESPLEQERANVQAEASQFVNQIHHQAQRVVDETQSKAATEVQSIVKRASTEVELVKAQANAELSRLRSESQKQMSMLEGRMAELIRINRNLHQKQNEQTALVDSLMQQIHNQNQVISQLQQAPMRSAASGPSNGTDFFQVSTPVGHNPFDPELRVGSEFAQETTHQKDLGVQPSGSARPGGIMPLGSVVQGDDGRSKGNRPKQHHASKESQTVESAMKEMTALPLCRQLRFGPICWWQCAHQTYSTRFSRYVLSCLLADITAVSGGQTFYFQIAVNVSCCWLKFISSCQLSTDWQAAVWAFRCAWGCPLHRSLWTPGTCWTMRGIRW